MRARSTLTLLAGLAAPVVPGTAPAQDMNVLMPADSVEYLLSLAEFAMPEELPPMRPGMEDDRTRRVSLWYDGGATGVLVQWAPAPEGGEEFNNVPRYELAAYELQKLFLPPPSYVVPPTAFRMVPLEWYRTMDEDIEATFDVGESVLVVLQYYLFNTTDEDVFDPDRFEADSVYARYWGNANLLTHFIEHKDANQGNLRISTVEGDPRVFAVDNGVAFGSEESNRGTQWMDLQVDRFPRGTVQRIMAVTEESLYENLGVLAQYELRGDRLVRVDPGENWGDRRGIRERDEGVQIGLTRQEISRVWSRMEYFVERIQRGWYEVF